MRTSRLLISTVLALATSNAWAACEPVKVAYVDQNRPPYYLGDGSSEASPPGASAELLHEIAASAGCTINVTRLPYLRLRDALHSNRIDAAPLSIEGQDEKRFAYPLDKNGKLDPAKAMRMHTVLFVRASDKVPADIDPLQLIAGKRVGVIHGSSVATRLRALGAVVDDGASTAPRNLEKMMLGRIDVFAVSLVSPEDADVMLAARYGKDIVRIDKPIQTTHLYFAFSKPYYARHRDQVETMWRWIGSNGNARFVELVRKYDKS